jgi:hypothetical protein
MVRGPRQDDYACGVRQRNTAEAGTPSEPEDELMRAIMPMDRVRLTADLPELELYCGEVGVVRGAWLYPNAAYEVEFPAVSDTPTCRLLLLESQVAPESANV